MKKGGPWDFAASFDPKLELLQALTAAVTVIGDDLYTQLGPILGVPVLGGRIGGWKRVVSSGGLILTLDGNPKEGCLALMSHADIVGGIVRYVDPEGRVYFRSIGMNSDALINQRVMITTTSGSVRGIITGVPPHLKTKGEEGKLPEPHDLFIEALIGGEKKVSDVVEAGNPFTVFSPFWQESGHIVCLGLDNALGVWANLGFLSWLMTTTPDSRPTVHIFLTREEETGANGAERMLRDARAFDPRPDFVLNVDTTACNNLPGLTPQKLGGPVVPEKMVVKFTDRGAIYSLRLAEALAKMANGMDLECTRLVADTGATDGQRGLQHGFATGAVAIPCKALHTAVVAARESTARDVLGFLIGIVAYYPDWREIRRRAREWSGADQPQS